MQKKYSGNITLRVPKSLHEKLTNIAEEEGVSLNQYCLYVLSDRLSNKMLGKKEFNRKLVNIRSKYNKDDFKNLISDIKIFHKTVMELKPVIKREVDEIFSIRKSKLTLSDEEYLETKYPIISGSVFGEVKPFLKIPTLKLIISPINKNHLNNEELKKSFKSEEFNNQVIYSENNIDEIGEYCVLSYNCKVIYLLENDIDKVEEYLKRIVANLESSNQKDKFMISYSPTYILSHIEK